MQSVPINVSQATSSGNASAQESVGVIAESNLAQEKSLEFKKTYEAAKNKKSEHQQMDVQEQAVKRAWQDDVEASKASRQKADSQAQEKQRTPQHGLKSAQEAQGDTTEPGKAKSKEGDNKPLSHDILAQIQAAEQQVRPRSDSGIGATEAINSHATSGFQEPSRASVDDSKLTSKDKLSEHASASLNTPLNPISQILAKQVSEGGATQAAEKLVDPMGGTKEAESSAKLVAVLSEQAKPEQAGHQADTAPVSALTKVAAQEGEQVSEDEVRVQLASKAVATESQHEPKLELKSDLNQAKNESAVSQGGAGKEQQTIDLKTPERQGQGSANGTAAPVTSAMKDDSTAAQHEPSEQGESKDIKLSRANVVDGDKSQHAASLTSKETKSDMQTGSPLSSTHNNVQQKLSQPSSQVGETQQTGSSGNPVSGNPVSGNPASAKNTADLDVITQSKSQAKNQSDVDSPKLTGVVSESNKAATMQQEKGAVGNPDIANGFNVTKATPQREQVGAGSSLPELAQNQSKTSPDNSVDTLSPNKDVNGKETILGDKLDTRAALKQQGKEMAAQAHQEESFSREASVKEQTQTSIKGQGMSREPMAQPIPAPITQQAQSAHQPPNASAQFSQVLGGVAQTFGMSQATTAPANPASAFEISQKFELAAKEAPSVLRERITMMMNKGITQAEIKLDPAELGSMHVKLSMQNDQLSIQVQTTQAQSKELVEQHMPRLREMLNQQGINLGESQVGQQQSGSKETAQSHQQDHRNGQGEQQVSNANEVELRAVPNYVQSSSAIDYYA